MCVVALADQEISDLLAQIFVNLEAHLDSSRSDRNNALVTEFCRVLKTGLDIFGL